MLGHTVSIQIRPPTTGARPQFFRIRDTLATLPGVEVVSSGDLPIGLVGFNRVYKVGGTDDGGFSIQVNRVGPRYLEAVGVPLLRGRDFRDEDVRETSTSVTPVIIGESLARRYLGSVDAVGQELELGGNAENGTKARRLQVVGVSEEGAMQVFGGERVPVLYFPALSTSLVVRVAESSVRGLRMLRQAVETLLPGADVTAQSMTDRLSAVFRVALGATWSAIVRLIVRDAVLIVGAGSTAGAVLSFALIRAIWPLLSGNPTAFLPLVLLVVLALTLAVGTAAALRPALSAARADPMLALRQD